MTFRKVCEEYFITICWEKSDKEQPSKAFENFCEINKTRCDSEKCVVYLFWPKKYLLHEEKGDKLILKSGRVLPLGSEEPYV